MKLEIEKTLVISLTHLKDTDLDKIKRQARSDQTKLLPYPELMVEDHSFGAVVILGDPTDRASMVKELSKDFSENFCNCINLGISLEVDNVRFDESGSVYTFLAQFPNWD